MSNANNVILVTVLGAGSDWRYSRNNKIDSLFLGLRRV